jgi:hypothetical protein
MDDWRRGPRPRGVLTVAAVVAIAATLVLPAAQARAASSTIPRPEGAGPPVAASGMGTQAALDNPRCRHDDPKYGPYGRFDSTELGGASACVKAWKAGDDNGGATAQGVTKDTITVVAVIPNAEEQKTDPVAPKNRGDNSASTYQNAVYDYLLPQMRFYETWGRDIEIKFVVSSGDDEAAMRADAVKIKAMKPFAVLAYGQTMTGTNGVLETALAAAKIPVIGYAATQKDMADQAPYRWNSADGQAAVVNSAEVIGKQLVGKKAQYGGDDVKNQTRKFGVVYYSQAIDYKQFTSTLAKYKGTVTSAVDFGTTTDPSQVTALATTAVSKMKAAGVTTVLLFAASVTDLMTAADKQEWTPEWFYTGAGYADLAILARGYPATQAQHSFGLSAIAAVVEAEPVTPPAVSYTTQVDPLNWYWGQSVGTAAARVDAPLVFWLLPGIQAAGPKLTAATFKQGLFAIPARGGAQDNSPNTELIGFGKAPKLPYDEYGISGLDFAPVWFDPSTSGPSNGVDIKGMGVEWFPDGGKRYLATTWPTKPFTWFEKQGAIYQFNSADVQHPGYVGDCKDCPSQTGSGSPDAPSSTAIVFKAGGSSASAA